MKKYLSFFSGILIVYFGVALTYKANIGVGPSDANMLSIANIIDAKVGNVGIVINLIYFVLQIIILRRDFKVREFLQLVLVVASGLILNLFLYNVLKNFTVSNYGLRVLLYTVAVFVKTVGVLLIMNSSVCKTTLEGLADAVAFKLNKKMGFVRQIFDVFFVISVLLISFIFSQAITIGLGTVIDMVLFGPLLEILKKPFRKRKLKEKVYERTNL